MASTHSYLRPERHISGARVSCHSVPENTQTILKAKLSAILAIAAYNVAKTLPDLLEKIPYHLLDEVVVVDDGSQDGTAEAARNFPVTVIEHGSNKGVGRVIKTGLRYALDRKYDVFVIMAGNGKDNPDEIPRLL